MQYIIPVLILALFTAAVCHRANAYDSFIRGAKKALPLIVTILPALAAMLCTISLFRKSGALSLFTYTTAPIFRFIGIPDDLITLILLRPFSGSAAIALLQDVYNTSGVNSYSGYLASVIVGSSETIFYTVALYFGSVGIKKTRHAVLAAVVSGIVAIIVSVIMSTIMYR